MSRLVVLAGQDYWRCLAERGLEIVAPLDGLGIGQRLRWLKQHTAAGLVPGDRQSESPSLFRDDAVS